MIEKCDKTKLKQIQLIGVGRQDEEVESLLMDLLNQEVIYLDALVINEAPIWIRS